MNEKQWKKMYRQIEEHGRDLLVLYPDATEPDPVKLCKKLRRIDLEGHAFAERLCDGPEYPSADALEEEHNRILAKAVKLLGYGPRIFLNQDPRGYALKIDCDTSKALSIHKDWGGYGIIAPDFTPQA
jgi:hypothetical protein